MFLQILGILFLIVIVVAGYFAWRAYRFAKSLNSSDLEVAISVLPAMEMELEPSSSKAWKEQERLQHTESELKKVGATHVGYYCVYSGYAIIRVSIWNYRDQATAAIYEVLSEIDKDDVSFIYEVSCKLDSGTLCITSNQHAAYESRPAEHRIVFKESSSIIDFLKAIKTELPEGQKIRRITDPKDYFLQCYEDVTEWSWRPDQLNSNKTRQMLSSVGVNVTEELMDQLVDIGISHSVEVNIERARKNLAKKAKMSADQWEKVRDRLVFINERMQVHHLIEAIYELSGDLSDSQDQVIKGFQQNTEKLIDPIAAFQMLLTSLNLKAKRVSSMERPVRTEVYISL